jgi:hypothetical protein
MDVKLLQPRGEGGITARVTKTTLDVRPKLDLQQIGQNKVIIEFKNKCDSS